MRCSHCIRKEGDPLADAGFVEKLERMASEGVEIVHIGVCAGRNAESACPGMLKMIEAFEDKGMKTVWGRIDEGETGWAEVCFEGRDGVVGVISVAGMGR
jgi:hypothetical protein